MPDIHAKLSASGSDRWMHCPGSVVLEEYFEDEGSEYASEGTQAHAIAETRMRARLDPTPQNVRNAEYAEETTDAEMWAFTGQYEDYCSQIIDGMQLQGRIVRAYVEQRVQFNDWVPDGFGTVDFCAVGGDDLHIVDFKYGKGVKVSAKNNSQMRDYALGFLQEFALIYDNLKTVTMHIVQPRINNVSSETLTVEELLEWAEKELKPKAQVAYNNTREYAAGKHCKFCKAKAVCKARANSILGRIADILMPF